MLESALIILVMLGIYLLTKDGGVDLRGEQLKEEEEEEEGLLLEQFKIVDYIIDYVASGNWASSLPDESEYYLDEIESAFLAKVRHLKVLRQSASRPDTAKDLDEEIRELEHLVHAVLRAFAIADGITDNTPRPHITAREIRSCMSDNKDIAKQLYMSEKSADWIRLCADNCLSPEETELPPSLCILSESSFAMMRAHTKARFLLPDSLVETTLTTDKKNGRTYFRFAIALSSTSPEGATQYEREALDPLLQKYLKYIFSKKKLTVMGFGF